MDETGYRRRLQSALDFIEANLKEELPLLEVSRRANVSLYHFHRLFRAYVGESLKEYIRHRRLDSAARDLATTRRPIIEIALDYGYSVPESFLRAFKAIYGTTPSAFRKKGPPVPVHMKVDLFGSHAPERKGNHMEPRLVERDSFRLIGGLIHTSRGACRSEVAGFWAEERGKGRIGGLAREAGAAAVYGVCFGACEGCGAGIEADPEAFPYLIGWEAAEGESLPAGLVEMSVPGGKYAVFSVDPEGIDKAVDRIYGSWLSASPYELSDSPVLERYGASADSVPESAEIWLPIK